MSAISRHIIDRGDGAAVELFQAQTAFPPKGAILFVHGNQGGLLTFQPYNGPRQQCYSPYG